MMMVWKPSIEPSRNYEKLIFVKEIIMRSLVAISSTSSIRTHSVFNWEFTCHSQFTMKHYQTELFPSFVQFKWIHSSSPINHDIKNITLCTVWYNIQENAALYEILAVSFCNVNNGSSKRLSRKYQQSKQICVFLLSSRQIVN